MTRAVLTVLVLAAGAATIAAAQDHQKPANPAIPKGDSALQITTPDKVEWTLGPATFRKGAMMAILEGDPAKEGPFVFRLKLPDGFRVSPHSHPGVERLTVIQGTLNIGTGDTFDEKATKAVPAGSFCRIPAGMSHYGVSKGETVLQLTGVGPWGINYTNPADDPRKEAAPAKK